MAQKWEQGSAARQPQYDESPNLFTPVDYAARLNTAPKRTASHGGQYQPGQLYGYQPPVYSPPPAAAPVQEAPAYMQPQQMELPQFTPGAPYGANAYQNGPRPYPQAFEAQQYETPYEVSPEEVYEEPEEFRDAFTPAADPKPLKKIREEDLQQRRPVRVGRVIALVAAVVMFVFCAVAIVSIALRVDRDERSLEAAEQSFREENGVELQYAAARVELLPKGQTYEPTAEPAVTPYLPRPTPTPVIPVNEASVLAMAAVNAAEFAQEEDVEAAPLRTKQLSYPKNPLCNIQESLKNLIADNVRNTAEGADLSNIWADNADVIGRLVIPGLLDEIVVQRNNTYYLTHDYNGHNSDAGAVFADENSSIRMPPENLLLRGQSAVGGKVFAKLWQYVNGGAGFAASAATAQLTTLYEEESYVLFAVILSDSDPKSAGYFSYASSPTFATDEDMLAYVNQARARSLYPFSVDVNASDRLLTLATLGNGNQSVVLMYRMARENENY